LTQCAKVYKQQKYSTRNISDDTNVQKRKEKTQKGLSVLFMGCNLVVV